MVNLQIKKEEEKLTGNKLAKKILTGPRLVQYSIEVFVQYWSIGETDLYIYELSLQQI